MISNIICRSTLSILGLFCFSMVSGQIEQLPNSKRSAVDQIERFRYTSPHSDTISIKIVNPQGSLQSMPVKNRPVAADEEIDFSFNTQYLMKGQYRILVEGKENQATHPFNLGRKSERKKE